jgi:putative Mg2+ transporter-C (MgtC) family protein
MTLQFQILGEVALAMLLGGIIGFNREMANKPAGLRTHMFVSGAAALMVSLGDIIISYSGIETSLISTDPIRILEAILTGISFLGAGTILRQQGKDQVQGLTTAASLLFASGIGAGVALHQFVLAIGVTILALIVLSGVHQLERVFWKNQSLLNREEEQDNG